MPMVPQQLVVLRALTAHLAGINPENDDPATEAPYALSLKGAVFRGRTTLADNDPYPAVSILESIKPEDGAPAGHEKVKRFEDWTLLLQGFATDDRENPTDPAYWLKAVVVQRLARLIEVVEATGDPLYPDEWMLGGLIAGLTIGQGVVRPPTLNVSPTAFFYQPLVVKLPTDVRKPYLHVEP